MLFTNNEVSLDPVSVRLDNRQTAQIDGQYAFDGSHTAFKIATSQLTIAEVEYSTEHVVDAPPIPVLGTLRQGDWKGWIAFDRHDDRPGVWSGKYELQNAVLEIPGLASPVRLASASVEMKRGQIQMTAIRARAGTLRSKAAIATIRLAVPSASCCAWMIPELKLAELERLMMPTLSRDEGFLARTFRLRKAQLPAWLAERKVEATIHVWSVAEQRRADGRSARAPVVGRTRTLQLSDLEWRQDQMLATGEVALERAGPAPAYQLTGNIENLEYRNGRLDIDGELETSGIGPSLLLNIRSHGNFRGPRICWRRTRWSARSRDRIASRPRPGSRGWCSPISRSRRVWTRWPGQGSSQPDGRIVLELTSGRRQVRLTGMLLPIRPER